MNIFPFRNAGFLAALFIASFIWSFPCGATPDQSSHQSRYVYCNVYADYACFGISSGDMLRMEIPGDFVMYSISLGNKVRANIYFGHNPQWNNTGLLDAKNCSKDDDSVRCNYSESVGKIDILYEVKSAVQFMHIQISNIDRSRVRDVLDFLENFRACRPVGQSAQCTEDRIFKNIEL